MANDGIRYYTKATIVYQFCFPEDKTTCDGCRYCTTDNVGRFRCKITDEILLHIKTERGHNCPVCFFDDEAQKMLEDENNGI